MIGCQALEWEMATSSPGSLPGNPRGQRSLAGYTVHGVAKSQTPTERLRSRRLVTVGRRVQREPNSTLLSARSDWAFFRESERREWGSVVRQLKLTTSRKRWGIGRAEPIGGLPTGAF